jgi:hypothetical protein
MRIPVSAASGVVYTRYEERVKYVPLTALQGGPLTQQRLVALPVGLVPRFWQSRVRICTGRSDVERVQRVIFSTKASSAAQVDRGTLR